MRHRHTVTEDPVKIVGIAAIAAAIGATVAMLFTPRSGGQLRRGLKRRALHLKDEAKEHLEGVGDEAEDLSQDAKQRLQSTATKVAKDTKAVRTRAKSTATAAKKPVRRTASSK